MLLSKAVSAATNAAVCLHLLLLLLPCDAQPGLQKVRFQFNEPGSAAKGLGLARLAKLRRNSNQMHKSIPELAAMIENDNDLGVDLANNRLIYMCSMGGVDALPPDGPEGALARVKAGMNAKNAGKHHHHHLRHRRNLLQADVEFSSPILPETADPDQSTLTTAQILSLHSRPGSTKKIFLDFDGHTIADTAWNAQFTNGTPIVMPPYDADGNAESWALYELSNIYAIWRAVAEDFAPFDVDVTTEEPTDLPLSQWIRHIIGGEGTSFLGPFLPPNAFAFGVAYVGSWGNETHYWQPSFTFSDTIVNRFYRGNRGVWETASHEIGHDLGLNHDGQGSAEYYRGSDGWAPIMGQSFTQAVSHWSKGEYADATNTEDDFEILSSQLGYVAQVHGTTKDTATPLAGATNVDALTATANHTGVIRSPREADVFSFTMARGRNGRDVAGVATFQVLVVPKWLGLVSRSNLNVELSISTQDAAGAETVVATKIGVGVDPFDVIIPAAGTYCVSIRSSGGDEVATAAGFTSYGSRGQYQLLATYPLVANKPRTFELPITQLIVESVVSGVNRGAPRGQTSWQVTVTVKDKILGAEVNGLFATNSGYFFASAVTDRRGTATLQSEAPLATTGPSGGCVPQTQFFDLYSIIKDGYTYVNPGFDMTFKLLDWTC